MQRWIAVGVVAMALLFGGGWFAYRAYKDNRPAPVWVPLPINPELPAAKCDELVAKLKAKLGDEDLLVKVSKDLGLARKLNVKSDQEAAREIGSRLFVKIGDMETKMGKVPAVHIGVTGKRKDMALSGEIAMRLMEDVWKILGIKPPPKK